MLRLRTHWWVVANAPGAVVAVAAQRNPSWAAEQGHERAAGGEHGPSRGRPRTRERGR